MALLCCMVSQLRYRTDGTGRLEDHFPGKICNLSGSQTSFHGEQNDHVVSNGYRVVSANRRRLSIWSEAKIFACLPGIFSVGSVNG
jgi:hypothetical protein